MRFLLAPLERLQLRNRRIAPGDELRFFFGVKSLLFRRHGELAFEAVELQQSAIAIGSLVAQLRFRLARPLLREDPRIVRRAQLLFERLQLRS